MFNHTLHLTKSRSRDRPKKFATNSSIFTRLHLLDLKFLLLLENFNKIIFNYQCQLAGLARGPGEAVLRFSPWAFGPKRGEMDSKVSTILLMTTQIC